MNSMTRTPNANPKSTPVTTAPNWMVRLVSIFRPATKTQKTASLRVNQVVDFFDDVTNLTSNWTGVGNRFNRGTWTCMWTPMSIWFCVAFKFMAAAVLVPLNAVLVRSHRARKQREESGEVKWTSFSDLLRVGRAAMDQARKNDGSDSSVAPRGGEVPSSWGFSGATAAKPISEEELLAMCDAHTALTKKANLRK